jgi:hypothetical protein
MSDGPAAISANLVDIRNVSTHKVVRLEIHVPAEQATLVMQAFGWPTMVAPIPVAVARLNGVKKPEPEPKEKRRWEDLKLSIQASIRCNEPAFWRFLNEEFGQEIFDEQEAAHFVRQRCGVSSRSALNLDPKAAAKWQELNTRYSVWLREPQHA